MNTKVKGKVRKQTYVVPSNQVEAEEVIKQIGIERREISRIEADMNDEIAEIKAKYELKAEPIKKTLSEKIEGVQAWAETNREELTNNGKSKTHKLATGEISWRVRPPKVTLRAKPKILQALKDLALTKFIRTAEEIDKEAILKSPDEAKHISGISIGSAGEDFNITPYELAIDNKK